jgi:hypothetical protein
MTVDSRASESSGERRKLQRLRSRESFVTSTAGEFKLVDVCPTGISIQGSAVRFLEPGQHHVFVVTDRGQAFEVTGEVRWTRLADDGEEPRAGVAFIDILSVEPEGLWAGICRDYTRQLTD